MSTIIKQEPVEEDDVVVTKVVSAEEQESSVASMMQMIPVNDRAKANMIARFPMDSRVLHSWWEKEEPYAVYGTISAVAIGLFNPHDVFYKVSFGNGDFKMLMNQDLLFGPDTPVWVLLPGTRHYTSCTVISAARPFAFSMTYTVSDATTRKIFCAVHDKHVCYRWDDQPPKIDEALLVDEVSLFPEQDTRNDQEQPNAVALPQGKSKDPERPNAVVAEQSTVLTSSAETQEASTHQDSVASNDSLPSTVYVAGEEAEPKTTDLMNDDQDMFRESSNKDNSMLSFNFLSPSQPKRRRVSRSPEEGEIDDGEVLLLTERTIRIPFWANSKQLKAKLEILRSVMMNLTACTSIKFSQGLEHLDESPAYVTVIGETGALDEFTRRIMNQVASSVKKHMRTLMMYELAFENPEYSVVDGEFVQCTVLGISNEDKWTTIIPLASKDQEVAKVEIEKLYTAPSTYKITVVASSRRPHIVVCSKSLANAKLGSSLVKRRFG